MEPNEAILKPNAMQTVNCFFGPQQVKPYILKLSCYFSHCRAGKHDFKIGSIVKESLVSQIDSESVELDTLGSKVSITIMGQGVEGGILCDEKVVDFGSVLVNHQHVQTVALYNPSDCDLLYKLTVSPPNFQGSSFSFTSGNSSNNGLSQLELIKEFDGEDGGSSRVVSKNELNDICMADLEGLFVFEPDRNVIPARSKINIKIKTTLSEQKRYLAQLNYVLIQQDLSSDKNGFSLMLSESLNMVGVNIPLHLSDLFSFNTDLGGEKTGSHSSSWSVSPAQS